jgi:hypothetical protein
MTMNIAVHNLLRTSFLFHQRFGEVNTKVEFLHSIDDVETFHCEVSFYQENGELSNQEFDIDIRKYNVKNS